jgi:hypothetical protein
VLSPLATMEDTAAVEAAPHLIRVTRAIPDRQIRVVGVLAKSWALREWYADLLYSLPLAGLCSAIIAFLVIGPPQTEYRPRSRSAARDRQG